jgi:hypothetical protein
MLGADADGNPIFGQTGEVVLRVENRNNAMLMCKGEVTNDSGRAQQFSGFDCGIALPRGGFVITTDSRTTVSADGNATMTCRV